MDRRVSRLPLSLPTPPLALHPPCFPHAACLSLASPRSSPTCSPPARLCPNAKVFLLYGSPHNVLSVAGFPYSTESTPTSPPSSLPCSVFVPGVTTLITNLFSSCPALPKPKDLPWMSEYICGQQMTIYPLLLPLSLQNVPYEVVS